MKRIDCNNKNHDAVKGKVHWSPLKSVWVLGVTATSVLGCTSFVSWDGVAVFLISCALVLCLGHSLGMHRLLVHRAYSTPLWLEYFFVYCGVLVGLAGPLGMIRTHDLRDWAQRQEKCHDFFAHRRAFFTDAWWQLHCDIKLAKPPEINIEARVAQDPIYQFMEKHWLLLQLPVILMLYLLGGWGWVFWGGFARVAACVHGHWLIGYFAHRNGQRHWHVGGAGVQGHNLPLALALITMGESWHNNHHAFPESALIGINQNEPDPGWWLLKVLETIGLVSNLLLPKDLPPRPELQTISEPKRKNSCLCFDR